MESISKGFRPPNPTPARTPPLGALVDYEDDDDLSALAAAAAEDPVSSLRCPPTSSQNQTQSKSPLSPSLSIPTSPKLTHRQVNSWTPPNYTPNDDEHNLMASWSWAPHSPSIGTQAKLTMSHMRPSEKRRRDDDDESLLERLNKAKKPDLGTQKDSPAMGARQSSIKLGDNPPKKFKLKLGTTSLGAASSPSPLPSQAGAKNGDTG